MLCEVDSLMVLPNKYYRSQGPQGQRTKLFNKVKCQPSYIYAFIYFPSLDLKCTIFKEFCYYIQSLFNIIQFSVDVSHFNIDQISNCVVMRDLPRVLSDMINLHLLLFPSGYRSSVYNCRDVEYHVYSKEILAWCSLNSSLIRGPYLPCYRLQGFTPWIYIVKDFFINILGSKHI